ncbi:MAG: serine/threonine protein kinase [Xanthomonadales bacterium]|nr:serine/threonine protein kinase [Xanthomonadales bacterium]
MTAGNTTQGIDTAPISDGDRRLASGTQVGRLVVLTQVGEGGMGRVYGAYDGVLDRRVCLKFLKPESDGEDSNRRLIAEARALAQLSHPNILPLFDVGEFEDQVYLITEFVDGWTLHDWVAQCEPGVAEVLQAYAQAGAGLSAAHAAGIVHRDFKPDNVMNSRDQRVRVMDFGLAISARRIDDYGAGHGTPRFMAPEQLAGREASARSDQYAFCLSLCASLGADLEQLRRNPDALNALPLEPRLRQALRLGLAVEPDHRHADLAPVLAALRPQTGRAQRRGLLAMGATLVLLTAVFGYQQSHRPPLCQRIEQPSTVWQGSGVQRLRQAFLATGLSYAGDSFQRVDSAVQRYLGDWSDQQLSACQATHERNEQSADLLDRRMVCLEGQLSQLDALGRQFAHADPQLVDGALEAVLKLPSPSACADRQSLLSRVPVPSGEAPRAEYQRLDEQLAEAWAKRTAGRYQAALEQLDQIDAAVTAFDHLPTLARYTALRGNTLTELTGLTAAQPVLERALLLAMVGGDLPTAADSANGIALANSVAGSPESEVKRWFETAELILRQTRDPARKAQWANYYGQHLVSNAGQLERGSEMLASALTDYRRIYGDQAPQTASLLRAYAWAVHRSGDQDKALTLGKQALDGVERGFGTHHNAYLVAANNYANMLVTYDRPDEALALLKKATQAGLNSVGAEHRNVMFLQFAYARALTEKGQTEPALAQYQALLRSAAKVLGERHRLYGAAAAGSGSLLRDLGQIEASRQILQTVLDGYADSYPPIVRATLAFELAQTLAAAGASRSEVLAMAARAEADGADAPAFWIEDLQAFIARQ